MNKDKLAELMIGNAAELNRLYAQIKATHRLYLKDIANIKNRKAWEMACEQWHRRYESLALPGGWETDFLDKLASGDVDAVEKALCFLEVRPYFFRSGYHWKTILQKCKRAPVSGEQAQRLADLVARHNAWKARRAQSAYRGRKVRVKLQRLVSRCSTDFPIKLPDVRLDGLSTVGDLYGIICSSLRVEPNPAPDVARGEVIRRPKWTSKNHIEAYRQEFSKWHQRQWHPDDVWTTLVSAIADVCKVDDSAAISLDTRFALDEPLSP
jgi:hypothetical protein